LRACLEAAEVIAVLYVTVIKGNQYPRVVHSRCWVRVVVILPLLHSKVPNTCCYNPNLALSHIVLYKMLSYRRKTALQGAL